MSRQYSERAAKLPLPSDDVLLWHADLGDIAYRLKFLYAARQSTIEKRFIAAGRNPDGSTPEQPKPTLPSYKASDSTYRANYVGGRDFVGRLPGWGEVA